MLRSPVTTALLALPAVPVIKAAAADNVHVNIESLAELNVHLASTSSELKSVGFLSTGNFHAVQHELHVNVRPVYYSSYEDLHAALQDASIVAGLVSGTPSEDLARMHVFGSDQISPRAMLVQPGKTDLVNAIDAAVVSAVESGAVDALIRKHAPYEMLLAHSCAPSTAQFAWPDNLRDTYGDHIIVSSLGPYDWGNTDGNYTANPPVGFWPDYYELLEGAFAQQYGMRFQRAWYPTSAQVLQSVANGTAHTTEPYMMLGAAHGDVSRKTSFEVSCTTGASQDKYITRRLAATTDARAAHDPDALAPCARVVASRGTLAGTAVFAAGLLLGGCTCRVLQKLKRARPQIHSLEDEQP